jgi:hypothetical protein
MTTHELAGLLDHLREGLGGALKDGAGREFGEAAAAFREFPAKPLKEFVKEIRKSASPAGVAISQEQLIERIQACRVGSGDAPDLLMKDVNKLKQAELQSLLRALVQNPGKNKVAENRLLIRRLLETPTSPSERAQAQSTDGTTDHQIEEGYHTVIGLRDAPSLTIEDLRARFAPIRQYSKPVLDAIARKFGYDFSGGKDEIANRLLESLERMRISQLRGEVIRGPV